MTNDVNYVNGGKFGWQDSRSAGPPLAAHIITNWIRFTASYDYQTRRKINSLLNQLREHETESGRKLLMHLNSRSEMFIQTVLAAFKLDYSLLAIPKNQYDKKASGLRHLAGCKEASED